MKNLKIPILVLQWTLISFSVAAFVMASIDAGKLPFDFSSSGFKRYLSYFDPFSILFAATFVVITAHLAIERLGLMSEANVNSYKASNRTVWIQTVREFFSEIKEEEPQICKAISRNMMSIHDHLFISGYVLKDRDALKEFMDKFFAESIRSFEEFNVPQMNIACYPNAEHSFSLWNFQYMFVVMVIVDDSYTDCVKDMRDMYMVEVKKYSTKMALFDPKIYLQNKIDFQNNRRKGTHLH